MQRVSVTNGGAQARPGSDPFGGSLAGGISANGRFVVFRSDAANLAAHDTNRVSDVFVYDRAGHRVTRVSVSSKGRQANGPSGDPAISANGRYVAFWSDGREPRPRRHERTLGRFRARPPHPPHDPRERHQPRADQARCKAGACESTEPALSANGRYVAFESSATNLVAGDTNRLADVFVHDLRSGRTERVSVSSAGRQAGGDRTNNGSNAPAISADGRYVAFHSYASNLVRGDTNRVPDIFVRDRKAPEDSARQRLERRAAGRPGKPRLLGDQRATAATSRSPRSPRTSSRATSTGSRDVFVHDLRSGHDEARQPRRLRQPGRRRERRGRRRLQRGRSLPGLLVLGREPRPARHERQAGRVRCASSAPSREP